MKVFLGGQLASMNQSTNNTEVKEANHLLRMVMEPEHYAEEVI